MRSRRAIGTVSRAWPAKLRRSDAPPSHSLAELHRIEIAGVVVHQRALELQIEARRDERARGLHLRRSRLRHFNQRGRPGGVPILRGLKSELRRAYLRLRDDELLLR